MTTRIEAVDAWEALDSRGRPTVACRVALESGAAGTVRVPSGASTGRHEAVELRDGGTRYAGAGVRGAVGAVRGPLAAAVRGLPAGEQAEVDAALRAADGTAGLGRLGGNAVLAVSVAVAVAAAADSGEELYAALAAGRARPPTLPLPMVNVFSGGAHAAGTLDIQDVLVVPLAARSFAEAIETAAAVRRCAAELARRVSDTGTLVADEGGVAVRAASNEAALGLLTDAFGRAGLRPGVDAGIAVDVAASQFATGSGPDTVYSVPLDGRRYDARGWAEELRRWVTTYPVVSMEDPMAEDDRDGWAVLADRLPRSVQVIGDDLFATHLDRLERGIEDGCADAVLVKPNQVGTLSDAVAVLDLAAGHGLGTVVSARSGDTEDSWLADLAVGWSAGQIKVGSTTRSERTAKWNRLLELEHRFAGQLPYAGAASLRGRGRRAL